jgi:co-chaperonin GroES (HSP10)
MGKEKNEKATVVAVGPGKHTITGDFIKTQIQIGDVVILPTMGFTKLEHDSEEYYVGPENQILAKIKNEQ